MSRQLVFVVSGKSPKTMPGGLGAYSFNTANALRRLGHNTKIIGFSETEEVTSVEGVDLIHIKNPFQRVLGLGAFLMAPRFARAMLEVIERERPQGVLVVSAGSWGAAGVELQTLCRERGIPLRTYVAYFTTYQHEYEGHVRGAPASDYGLAQNLALRSLTTLAKGVLSPREHHMLRVSNGVIVHYESTRKLLFDEIPDLRPERVHKIPYYVDLYERQSEVRFEKAREGGPARVNVICRQDPRKGINTFLKALRLLVDRGVPFQAVVAGSGIFLDANRKLAERLGLGERVKFPGFVPSTEEVLENTDVYVLPSVEEGSGAISLLEAMRAGKAIVTTRCDGIPEDFVDGETALLVDMNDSAAMATSIERLVRDTEFRGRLAENARLDYARRFSLEKMQDGLAQLFGKS
jgi:glycosyltransferase involved in cell wall biosynthesis